MASFGFPVLAFQSLVILFRFQLSPLMNKESPKPSFLQEAHASMLICMEVPTERELQHLLSPSCECLPLKHKTGKAETHPHMGILVCAKGTRLVFERVGVKDPFLESSKSIPLFNVLVQREQA